MRVSKVIGIATVLAFTVGLSTTGPSAGAAAPAFVPSPRVLVTPGYSTDPSGDETGQKFAQGDLRSARVFTRLVSGVPDLFVSATVASWVAPTSPNWTQNDTFIDWFLDVNGDGVSDFDLFFGFDVNSVHVDVMKLSTHQLVCSGAPSWSSTAMSYVARVRLSCLGNPASVRVKAHIRYSKGALGAALDNAPSAGFSPFFVAFRPNQPGTPGVSAGSRSLHVIWTAPVPSVYSVTDYVVQYRPTTSAVWTTYPDGVSTALAAHIAGLTAGKTYVVRIFAKNQAGLGIASATSAARTVLP